MSKRILSLVLALVMVLGTFGTVFAAEPTNNERVNKLIELGLVKGDGKDYRLEDNIRRDEVAAMVVRAMDLESVADAMIKVPTKFVDVKAGEWNNGYVSVAEGKGIVKGTGGNKFAPDRAITYQEVAAMLVRVIGLDAKEEATYSWPASYVAKAQELGILKDVEIASMGNVAVRERVFEMVYNTINNKNSNLLVASTVEGIVVENYRTERLAKDVITVHVMKDQVQREGKYYEKDDEFEITINSELKAKGYDVETLLGKVVTVSFDKAGKVISIEEVAGYKYYQGSLDDIREKDIKVNGAWYTVAKDEGRNVTVDERLYQVYLNNEDLHYFDAKDFDKDDKVVTNPKSFVGKAEANGLAEYARITVRNGKVLFIDAFAFSDIAPVAKDIDKDTVKFYNDNKDGDVDTLTVKDSAYVIAFEEDAMKLGMKEDIKADDVIHWYKDTKDNLTVIVRPEADNKVEGTYKDVSAKKAKDDTSIMIKVDDTEYPAEIKEKKRDAVYSYTQSEGEFFTVTGDYDIELAPFEKEKVVVLLDMFGNVQSIAAEKVDGSFYAVVSDTSRSHGDIKLVKADNSNEWYKTNSSTEFKGVDGTTKDKQFDKFGKYDLVRATLSEDLLTVLTRLTDNSKDVEKINKDIIDFGLNNYFYIGKNTTLFVAIDGKAPKAMTVADFIKNYYTDSAKENYEQIKGYVVEHARDEKLADVIVITEANAVKDETKDLTVKVTKVRIEGSDYRITVKASNGNELRKDVTTDTLLVTDADAQKLLTDKKIVAGSVVKITVTDDEAQKVSKIVDLLDNHEGKPVADTYRIVKMDRDRKRGENYIVLEDAAGKTRTKENGVIWVSRLAHTFYDYKVDDIVAIDTIDGYNTIKLLDVRGTYPKDEASGLWTPAEPPKTTGVVTYTTGTALDVTLPEGAVVSEYAVVIGENARGIVAGKADFVGVLENGKIYTAKLVKVAELDKAISTVTFVANVTAPVEETVTLEDVRITSLSDNTIKVAGNSTLFRFNAETEYDIDGTVTIDDQATALVAVGDYVTLVVKGNQVVSLTYDTAVDTDLKAAAELESAKTQLANAIADAEALLADEKAVVGAVNADDKTALGAAFTTYENALKDNAAFATAIKTAKDFVVEGKTAAAIVSAAETLAKYDADGDLEASAMKTFVDGPKATFDTAVETLTDARDAFLASLAAAEEFYNTEKARLDGFSPSEIAALGTDYTNYATAINTTLKAAITAANTYLEGDFATDTAGAIDTETAKIVDDLATPTSGALKDAMDAKGTFDAAL